MYHWRKVKPHEWWLLSADAPEDPTKPDANNVLHPPSLVIHWTGGSSCCHLFSYSNGVMPGEEGEFAEESTSYLHICNPSDFIAELQDFIEVADWRPQ